MKLENPFACPGHWFKANLHTHTTTSDGDAPLAQRIEQYRAHGYHILAVTDHELTNDVTGLSSKDFLVLSGMETHPDYPYDETIYHLVCLNVPQGFGFEGHEDANTRIKKVRNAGGEVIFAHPYWCGHNINHLLALDGYIGIEVFNSTCAKIGKAFSSVQWDDLLAHDRILPAVAVDDVHRGRDQFLGWTFIKAQKLTPQAIMDALRKGRYYASCGPVIEDCRIENDTVKITCSPAREVHFMSRNAAGYSFYADQGPLITSAQRPLADNLGYLRVEIVDAQGQHAWTNPLMY